ncbi:hypothetical protein MKW98_015475, partial [Papaver atlanticum]
DETYYPYRDISVFVMDSKLTLLFPHMDREKIDLKEFEQMLRVKLRLDDSEIPSLY